MLLEAETADVVASPPAPAGGRAAVAVALKMGLVLAMPLLAVSIGAERSAEDQWRPTILLGLVMCLAAGGLIAVGPEARSAAVSDSRWARDWFPFPRGVVVALKEFLSDDEDKGGAFALLGFAVFVMGAAAHVNGPPRAIVEQLGGGSAAVGAQAVLIVALVIVLLDGLLGRFLRELPMKPPGPRRLLTIAAACAVVVPLLYALRPVVHYPALVIDEYPLVTWIPVALGFAAVGAATLFAKLRGGDATKVASAALRVRWAVAVPAFIAAMLLLPSWQGRALYDTTAYRADDALPRTTQPRILPKVAAQRYGERAGLRDAHLAVAPSGGELVWTGEIKSGLFPRGASHEIGVQPLDRVDGTLERRPGGFATAVTAVGPGSLLWRAYDRHPLTRMQYPVIVPLAGGGAIAVAPYIGFRGFPVRRPYWQGVYVLHQDGRLEDLTPAQAQARPELVRSGRLFPEELARDDAEAYGYRTGAAAALLGRDRTEVSDPEGNPQPYLTDIGDGQVEWVTVAHRAGQDDTIEAIFLTDAATGATSVWRPPAGVHELSNQGAAKLAGALDIEWQDCCDDNGDYYDIREVTEPRPVFVRGRFYYLVSIVPVNGLKTAQPVDRTVLVDAQEHVVEHVYDHADPGADARLSAFLRR